MAERPQWAAPTRLDPEGPTDAEILTIQPCRSPPPSLPSIHGTTRTIDLQTEVPGPTLTGRRSTVWPPAWPPRSHHLPGRGRRRARRDDHRPRREHVRRLRGRRRLPERRPLASSRRPGGAGAARALQPHGLHGRAVRELRLPCGAPARTGAHRRPYQGGVLQRRHRSGGERRQVRPRVHRPARGDRLRGGLPRPDVPVARPDVEDTSIQAGARAVRARGPPGAVSERVPRPDSR